MSGLDEPLLHGEKGETLMHRETGIGPEDLARIEAAGKLGGGYSAARGKAYAALLASPFPKAGDELWRQTTPDLFDFGALRETSPVGFQLLDYETRKPLAQRGLTIQQGFDGYESLLERILAGIPDTKGGAISALQLSVASGGCVIHLEPGTRVTAPVLVAQTPAPGSRCFAPLICVAVEQGAELSLVEELKHHDPVFVSSRIEIFVGDNAAINFFSIQDLSAGASYLGRHRFYAGRDARGKAFHAALGAAVSRLDLDCLLSGPGASFDLNSLYVADGSRHVDFHPTQDHSAPHCQSNLLCKGALRGESRGVYYGLIRVGQAAQKTDAYQKNRNLLLSTEARADAVPNLEIGANDVKCSHGASVGQVGSEDLFYLMSRGLNRQQAERVLVEGFFEEVTSRIQNPALHEQVNGLVLERLNA